MLSFNIMAWKSACTTRMLKNMTGDGQMPTVKEDMDVFYIAGHAHLCLPPTAFPRLVTVLSSRLFFSGAWSCYRQDKAGLPELGLSIIPLPSSEKKNKKNSAEAHQHTAEEERRK